MQFTPDVETNMGYCWATVYDAGPAIHQHLINVSNCWVSAGKIQVSGECDLALLPSAIMGVAKCIFQCTYQAADHL